MVKQHFRAAAIAATMFITAMSVQVQPLHAIPAYPGALRISQPDGTSISVRIHGDEHFNWYTTADGYPIVRQQDGFFYYAKPGGAALTSTGIKAADKEQRTGAEKKMLESISASAAERELSERYAKRRSVSSLKIMGETTYPTIGNRRALAILVDFPQTTSQTEATQFHFDNPKQLFSDMLNKQGFSQYGATGSVADYYRDSSNGQFELTFDVFGPVTMDNDVSYYGADEEKGTWQMIVEACEKLDSEIDFTQYDQNKDGLIDNVYVIYAGQGAADGGPSYTIWPHAGDVEKLSGSRHLFDGVRLNHYACSNELSIRIDEEQQRRDTLLAGIGFVCHEFTHVLGFPDLYNTLSQGSSFTPGTWSVMDVGSYNNDSHTPPSFSAYERMTMKWLEPTTLSEPADIILEPLSRNKACRINTPNENEMFILENRQLEGWDKYLPGHGMLIWHIAYEADRWQHNQVNTVSDYQCIDIEEADNIKSESTRAGDAFPGTAGVTQFTDDTTPGMLTLTGQLRCETPITDIEERNGQIHFKVKGGRTTLTTVNPLPATDVTPVSFTANWQPSDDAEGYKIDVWRLNGKEIEYAEGYRALPVTGNSCHVEGLSPETTYYYSVRGTSGDLESQPSAPVEVTTGVATFEYIAPTIAAPQDITETSFTANWLPLADAEGYKISVYTKEKGVADTVCADFTGGVKNLPEGWRTDCQMTIATKGYYGKAAPSLSMPADYNYIESPAFDDNVRGISFWYRERNNPSGENEIAVSTLTGSTWSVIETIPLPLPAATGTTVEIGEDKIPAGSKAVRIVYRRKNSGALAIDDVTIAHNDNIHNAAVAGWESHDAGDATSVSVNGLSPATTYYYRLRGYAGELTTIASAEAKVTTAEASHISATTQAGGISIVRSGNTLRVECSGNAATSVEVYTAGGQLLARKPLRESATAVFSLPSNGIYIVKAGDCARKVVM